MNQYFVYIITNYTRSVLYIGVTNNIERRICEHKQGVVGSFSKRYHLTTIVYIDTFSNITDAIIVEKKLKGWARKKKEQLIEMKNRDWKDLMK